MVPINAIVSLIFLYYSKECGDNAKQCLGLINHCTNVISFMGTQKCGMCEEGYGVPVEGASQCSRIEFMFIQIKAAQIMRKSAWD